MSEGPLVSVVMPVRDGGRHLGAAVESVIAQTLEDWELVVVDDGSTDDTVAKLEAYARRDARLRILSQPHAGVIAARNRGSAAAAGRYVAVMDADDVCLPARLEEQVAYLEAHHDIGAVGSWVDYIDEDGRGLGAWRTPTSPRTIDWYLHFETALAHPSVMLRRDLVRDSGLYAEGHDAAEDYELWDRLSRSTQLANLARPLVKRRVRADALTQRCADVQEAIVERVMQARISRLLSRDVSGEVVRALRPRAAEREPAVDTLLEAADVVRRIHAAYTASVPLGPTERAEVNRDAARRVANLTRLALHRSPSAGARLALLGLPLRLRAAAGRVASGAA